MPSLLLATRNSHKTREFAQLLGSEFEISDLTGVAGVEQFEENGRTFEENAILKAVTAAKSVAGLVVADDSGLEVEVLGGAPGILSARYAGDGATDQENVAKLLEELAMRGSEDRRHNARFCCALALVQSDEILGTFSGTVDGSILEETSGHAGFGYDPVFVPAGFTETFAVLGAEVKNRISHRAKAIEDLREYLRGMG